MAGDPRSPAKAEAAGSLLGIAPVLLAFVLLQRYFVAGLTAGAVKGSGDSVRGGGVTKEEALGVGEAEVGAHLRLSS